MRGNNGIMVAFLILLHAVFFTSPCHGEDSYITVSEWSQIAELPEYKKIQYPCEICEALEQNKALEASLKRDMQYAKKYGVVNYGRRDAAVQAIKRNDSKIAKMRGEYKALFKTPFKTSACKQIDTESCSYDLKVLEHKLVGKVRAMDDADQQQ